MTLHNKKYQKLLFIVWIVALISLCSIVFTTADKYLQFEYYRLIGLFISVSLVGCFVPKFFKIVIWGIFLVWLNTFYTIPKIKIDNYSFDTDEYYDIKNSCKNDVLCLSNMVSRFQNEIKLYYQSLEKQNNWKYSYENWHKNITDICLRYTQEYTRQICLYKYTYDELYVLRKIKWREEQNNLSNN